jgi:hypothetical protein
LVSSDEPKLGERFTGKQKQEHKAVVDWTIFHFFVMISILANFLCQAFLQQFVVSIIAKLNKSSIGAGIEGGDKIR